MSNTIIYSRGFQLAQGPAPFRLSNSQQPIVFAYCMYCNTHQVQLHYIAATKIKKCDLLSFQIFKVAKLHSKSWTNSTYWHCWLKFPAGMPQTNDLIPLALKFNTCLDLLSTYTHYVVILSTGKSWLLSFFLWLWSKKGVEVIVFTSPHVGSHTLLRSAVPPLGVYLYFEDIPLDGSVYFFWNFTNHPLSKGFWDNWVIKQFTKL